MRSPSDFVDLVASRCWWCGAPADSREHRMKKSDLVREFGKPPFTDLRTLTRFSGGDRHDFRGPNSKLVKSKPSMCTRCNNVRTQPFDAAWDRFGSYLVDHEAEILARRSLCSPYSVLTGGHGPPMSSDTSSSI